MIEAQSLISMGLEKSKQLRAEISEIIKKKEEYQQHNKDRSEKKIRK